MINDQSINVCYDLCNQFTRFQCGGLTVGLSWAHVLGDAFSAVDFITLWSKIIAGHVPPKSLHVPTHHSSKPHHQHHHLPPSHSENPISVKKTINVGEHWLAATQKNVETYSFCVTAKQLQHLVTTTSIINTDASYFELLSAIVWKSLCLARGDDLGINAVTICTSESRRGEDEIPVNGLVFSKVEAEFAVVARSDVTELAKLIAEKKMVENEAMEKLAEEDEGKEDFIVYGASLTFVDLEKARVYDVKLNGRKPVLANCTFHGVGDEGVVVVLPAPEEDGGDGDGNGRMITVTMPRKELQHLKNELQTEWGIV